MSMHVYEVRPLGLSRMRSTSRFEDANVQMSPHSKFEFCSCYANRAESNMWYYENAIWKIRIPVTGADRDYCSSRYPRFCSADSNTINDTMPGAAGYAARSGNR